MELESINPTRAVHSRRRNMCGTFARSCQPSGMPAASPDSSPERTAGARSAMNARHALGCKSVIRPRVPVQKSGTKIGSVPARKSLRHRRKTRRGHGPSWCRRRLTPTPRRCRRNPYRPTAAKPPLRSGSIDWTPPQARNAHRRQGVPPNNGIGAGLKARRPAPPSPPPHRFAAEAAAGPPRLDP